MCLPVRQHLGADAAVDCRVEGVGGLPCLVYKSSAQAHVQDLLRPILRAHAGGVPCGIGQAHGRIERQGHPWLVRLGGAACLQSCDSDLAAARAPL